MDSKYNRLIDNIAIRISLNTMVFALWLVAAVGLLELAVKVKSAAQSANEEQLRGAVASPSINIAATTRDHRKSPRKRRTAKRTPTQSQSHPKPLCLRRNV